jgi:hypothetical protein
LRILRFGGRERGREAELNVKRRRTGEALRNMELLTDDEYLKAKLLPKSKSISLPNSECYKNQAGI